MSDKETRVRDLSDVPCHDTETMAAWITAIENFADEQFPSVSPTCEDLLTELHRDLAGCIDSMRERLT